MNSKVDFFFEKESQWQKAYQQLRKIVLGCGLEETLKWGQPCYTYNNNNVVIIHGFKEYCALLLFKGALMSDPAGILIRQSENVQAARQIRFTTSAEITKLQKVIKEYIYQAIEIEKAGLKVKLKKTTEFPLVDEFKKQLDKKAALKKAFHALTPGRQRAYLLHFAAAKQAKTREARIEKAIPAIMKGIGLND